MSDTPRTDEELDRYRGPAGMVCADFARQLERELAAAIEREAARKPYHEYPDKQ